jgi:hypothetical protein
MDALEIKLKHEVAPKTVGVLEKIAFGGFARVREVRLDRERQLAFIFVDFKVACLEQAIVELRYDIRSRDLTLHSNLWNGTMRQIDMEAQSCLVSWEGRSS